jgi:hypothetical protein
MLTRKKRSTKQEEAGDKSCGLFFTEIPQLKCAPVRSGQNMRMEA